MSNSENDEALVDEVRKHIARENPGMSPDEVEEELYNLVAEVFGGLTKQQLLAIDLAEYEGLRTYPHLDSNEPEGATDWQMMRDKVLFLQSAVLDGTPWRVVSQKTFPAFGPVLMPPFKPIVQTLTPSSYQPPVYDQARQTPAEWAREADEGWKRHLRVLQTELQAEFDLVVQSGELKLFNRIRTSGQETAKNTPIIDEWTAYRMAARWFFNPDVQWKTLALDFPHGNADTVDKSMERRADQIRKQVIKIVEHLGLKDAR